MKQCLLVKISLDTNEAKSRRIDINLYLHPNSEDKLNASTYFKNHSGVVRIIQNATSREILDHEQFIGGRMAFRIKGLLKTDKNTFVRNWAYIFTL